MTPSDLSDRSLYYRMAFLNDSVLPKTIANEIVKKNELQVFLSEASSVLDTLQLRKENEIYKIEEIKFREIKKIVSILSMDEQSQLKKHVSKVSFFSSESSVFSSESKEDVESKFLKEELVKTFKNNSPKELKKICLNKGLKFANALAQEGHAIYLEKAEFAFEKLQAIVEAIHRLEAKKSTFKGMESRSIPPWESSLETMQKAIRSQVLEIESPSPEKTSLYELSLLNKVKPSDKVDKKMLAHIHGDTFIGSTGLEGNQIELVLDFVEETLQADLATDPLISDQFRRLIKSGCEGAKILNSSKENKLDEYRKFILKMLADDGPSSFLLEGGWTSIPMGHAMYYLVMKQPNGKFTIRIFNTGDGLNFHPSLSIGGKKKYHPFIEIQDVIKEKLSSEDFIQVLVEIKKPIEGYLSPQHKSEDVYGVILPFLDGKRVKRDHILEEYIFPQHSGICAWAGLMAVARTTLVSEKDLKIHTEKPESGIKSVLSNFLTLIGTNTPKSISFSSEMSKSYTDKIYQHFTYKIGLKSLISFYQNNKENLIDDPEARLLLQKCIKTFAHECMNAQNSGSINEKEFQEAYATLREISQQLESIDKCHVYLTSLERHLEFGERAESEFGKGLSIIFSSTSSSSVETSFTSKPEPLIWDFSLHPITSTSLEETLVQFNACCKTLFKQKEYKTIVRLINQMYLNLPLPKNGLGELDFWDKNRSTFSSIPILLKEMGAILFQASLQASQDKDPPPIEVLFSLYKGVAILTKFLPPKLAEIALPVKDLEFLFFGSKGKKIVSNSSFYSPEIRKQIYSLQKFYSAKKCDLMIECDSLSLFSKRTIDLDDTKPKWGVVEKYLKEDMPELLDSRVKTFKNPKLAKNLFAMASIAAIKGDFSPIFESLQSQAYALQFLLYTESSIKKEERLKASLLGPVAKIEDLAIVDQNLQIKTTYTDRINLEIPTKVSRNLRRSKLLSLLEIRYSSTLIKKLFEDLTLDDFKSAYSKLNNFTNLEELKELLLLIYNNENSNQIFSSEIGAPGFQITKLLSYFTSHLDSLDKGDFQDLFSWLLFEDRALEKWLESNPRNPQMIINFLTRGYNKAREEGNINTCCFFQNMKCLLLPFLSEYKVEISGNEIRKELIQLFETSGLNPKDRTLISKLIIASYHDEHSLLKIEDVQLILKSLAHTKIAEIPSEQSNETLEDQVENVLLRVKKNILEYLKSEHSRNKILNAVLESIGEKSVGGSWDISKLPLCMSSDGKYGFDITEGTLYERGGKKKQLPESICQNSDYLAMFGKRNYIANCVGDELFEFVDHRNIPTRIIRKNSELFIQQKLKGESEGWYEFKSQRSNLFYSSHLSAIKNYYFSENCTYWHPIADCLGKSTEILILDNNSHDFSYRISLRPSSDKHEIEYIERFEKGGIPRLILIDTILPDNPYFPFINIENRAYINIWKNSDPSSSLKRVIEMPRMGLQFNVEDKQGVWRAHSPTFPGYFLSEKQYVKGLGDFNNYLLLENNEGQKKLIIPRRQIHYSNLGTGALNTQVSFILDNIENDSAREFLEYDVDSLGNVQSFQTENRFFLAYLYLGLKQYEKAMELLRDAAHSTKIFTPKIRENYRWIHRLQRYNKDKDPKATAVFLCLEASILRYEEQFGEISRKTDMESQDEPFQLATAYKDEYLLLSEYTTALQLTLEEETILLKNFIKLKLDEGNVFANRLQELDPKGEELDVILNIPSGVIIAEKDLNFDDLLYELKRTNRSMISVVSREDSLKDSEIFKGKLRLLRGGVNFLCQFLENYSLAKKKDPALIKRLAFMKNDEYNKNLRKFLELVWMHPDQFPTIDNLIKILEKEKENNNEELEMICRKALSINKKLSKIKDSVSREIIGKKRKPKFIDHSIEPIAVTTTPKSKELNALPLVSKKVLEKIFIKVPFEKESSVQEEELDKCLSEFPKVKKDVEVDRALPISEKYALKLQSFEKMTPDNIIKQILVNESEILFHINKINRSRKGEQDVSINDIIKLFTMESEGKKLFLEKHPNLTSELDDIINNLMQALQLSTTNEVAFKENLSRLEANLLVQATELKKQAMITAESILKLANRTSEKFSGVSEEMQRLSGTQVKMNMNDILILFLQKDGKQFKKRNPELSNKDIEVLTRLIVDYLVQDTRRQQVERAARTVCEIRDLNKFSPDDPEVQDLTNLLHQQLTARRAYIPSEHPDYLLFEFCADIMLRKDQFDNLEKLISPKGNPNVILQMIMGSGKTKVLLPILALKNAQPDHLSLIIVPDALYETVVEDFRSQSRGIFRNVPKLMEFDRNTKFSLEELNKIKSRLKNIQAKKECLIMTPKSIACFPLKLEEALYEFESNPKADKALYEKICVLRDILRILQKSKAVVDEADLIFNSRKEINFSLGKAESLKIQHRELAATIYECLLPYHNFETISETQYYEKIREPLIKEFLAKMQENSSSPFADLMKEDKRREFVIDYLNNKSTKEQEDVIKKWNPELRHLLALAKEHFNHLLPLTLGKACDTHFGFSAHWGKSLAVPYIANNTPNEITQFGNPYELLNYTMITYSKKGIPFDIMSNYIENLRNSATKEKAADPKISLEETMAYQSFFVLCGGDKKISFLKTSPEDIKAMAKRLHETRVLSVDKNQFIDFLKNYILPDIKMHTMKLTMDGIGLASIFDQIQGFTGTPWNSDTFHDKIKTETTIGTDGKTIRLLWKQCQKRTFGLSSTAFPAILDNLLNTQKGVKDFRAIIDTGAIFNGVNNEIVAHEILMRYKSDSKIKGVCFYRKDQLMVLERGKTDPIPFHLSSLKEDERFTYYDHRHTTGTDIKQARRARAVVTIGKDTTSRDLLQGVWRMRQLGKGQEITVVYPSALNEILRQSSKLSKTEPIGFKHILRHVLHNEAQQLAEHCVIAAKQKIRHALKHEVWKVILDPKTTPTKMKSLFSAAKSLFITKMEDSPFDSYGKMEKLEDAFGVITKKIDQELLLYASIARELDPSASRKTIESSIKHFREKMLNEAHLERLPAKLPSVSRDSENSEVETEEEREVEKEVEKQTSTVTAGIKIVFQDWSAIKSSKASIPQIFSSDCYRVTMDKSLKEKTITDHPSILSLDDALALSTKDKTIPKDVLDEDLIATHNFLPIKQGISLNHPDRELSQYRLIIRDKKTKKIKTMAMTQVEGHFFSEALQKKSGIIGDLLQKHKKQAYDAKMDVELFLYDKNLGVLENSEGSDIKSLKEDPQYLRQMVQMDFLDGDMSYPKEKQEALSLWIAEKGASKLKTIFKDIILLNKPHQRAKFEDSTLGKLIEKIAKKSSK